MSLRINTNIAAMNAHRLLTQTDSTLGVSIERLSSGLRINHAKDDVAGLSIANNLRMESRGLKMAQQNVTQGTALLQMAEGGANQIESIVERLKELATSAASSNVDDAGRQGLNSEAQNLLAEIDRIAKDTKYGTTPLLSGNLAMTFQIGSASDPDVDQISVSTSFGLLASNLGTAGLNSTTFNLLALGSAQDAITNVNGALSSVNVVLGQIGAAQSRFTYASANLAVKIENIDASQSSIRDVDMAAEMTTFTKNQILLQAGTAMLAQANMMPQSILSLLK
jgi:flagellin